MKNIRIYTDSKGKMPFDEWLSSIKDRVIKARIRARLDRVSLGNFGDYKLIAHNLWELRLQFGSGYRIYYTVFDDEIVILLCGGDKNTQSKDIKKAKSFLKELMERCDEQAKVIEEYH